MTSFLKGRPTQVPSGSSGSKEAGKPDTTNVAEKEILPQKFTKFGKTDVQTFLQNLELDAATIENDKILRGYLNNIANKIEHSGAGAIKTASALTTLMQEGKLAKKAGSSIDDWANDMMRRLKAIKTGQLKIVPLEVPKPENPILHVDEDGVAWGRDAGYLGTITEVRDDSIILDWPLGDDADTTREVQIFTYIVPEKGNKVIHQDVNGYRPKRKDGSIVGRTDPADFRVGQLIRFTYDVDGVCHSPSISGKKKTGDNNKNSESMGILSKKAATTNQPDATVVAETATQTAPVKSGGLFSKKPVTPPAPPVKTPEEQAKEALEVIAEAGDISELIIAGDLLMEVLAASDKPGDPDALLTAERKAPTSLSAYFEIEVPADAKPGDKLSFFVFEDAAPEAPKK